MLCCLLTIKYQPCLMDYSQYDVEDFVADSFFSRWVKRPDDETNSFWKKWMENHPEKSDTIAQAKSILHFLSFQVEAVTPEEHQQAKTQVLARIRAEQPVSASMHLRRNYFSIAAAIALLLMGSYVVWRSISAQSYQQYATGFGEQREVVLPDSTRIKLNANSSLRFKENWTDFTIDLGSDFG